MTIRSPYAAELAGLTASRRSACLAAKGADTDRAAASGDGDAFAMDGPWDLRWVRGGLLDDDAPYRVAGADCFLCGKNASRDSITSSTSSALGRSTASGGAS